MEEVIANLLSDFERGKMSRRQLVQSLAAGVAAITATSPALSAQAAPAFKAIAVNHISYNVADYARTRDFYADLLGMEVHNDNGSQCFLAFGNTFLLPRKSRRTDGMPYIDHVAYTLANWDEKHVQEELTRRGLNPRLDPGGPRPDNKKVNSFHIKDPDGFDVQVSGENMKAY